MKRMIETKKKLQYEIILLNDDVLDFEFIY